MKLSAKQKQELAAGVTQTRLAELAGLSASTVRAYVKDGLVPARAGEGKKTYGPDALDALETIKKLRADGLGLAEIAARLNAEAAPSEADAPPAKPASNSLLDAQTEAALRARVEQLRAQLEQERAKLAKLAEQMEHRVVQRRNELVLTKQELEELERLRESNIRRAIGVTRRTTALRYATTRKGAILFDPKKKK